MQPLILGLDCATLPASIALVRGAEVLSTISGPGGRQTDGWILGAIDTALGGTGVNDLTALAVTVGPGTFTGIRVGMATAMGIAAGGRLPLAGISTLLALAQSARLAAGEARPVLACIDARRQEVYAALYGSDDSYVLDTEPLWGPRVCQPIVLNQHLRKEGLRALAIGSGVALVDDHAALIDVVREPPSVAEATARLLSDAITETGLETLPAATPVYLRRPDARPLQRHGAERPTVTPETL